MDPPVMMNGGGFRSGNTGSSLCNLTEIWPFPMNLSGGGGGNASSFGMGQLGDDSGTFVDNPMVVDQIAVSKKRREDDDSSKGVSTSSISNGNSMVINQHYLGGFRNSQYNIGSENNALDYDNFLATVDLDGDGKRLKKLALENENSESKPEAERSSGKKAENSAKASEPPKQDYIHVRARRGQATDSHSLAERARREKISERMKILQDLVPGCNKVIGKALVLDEIINYIQSLQQQVEFLSMKLEAVTSRSHPSPLGFPSKDFGQQAFDMAGVPYGSQPTREFSRGSSPEWLHMQIGGSFERST